MLNQSDYDLVVSVLVAVLASLNHRKKEQHGSRDLVRNLTRHIFSSAYMNTGITGYRDILRYT